MFCTSRDSVGNVVFVYGEAWAITIAERSGRVSVTFPRQVVTVTFRVIIGVNGMVVNLLKGNGCRDHPR